MGPHISYIYILSIRLVLLVGPQYIYTVYKAGIIYTVYKAGIISGSSYIIYILSIRLVLLVGPHILYIYCL